MLSRVLGGKVPIRRVEAGVLGVRGRVYAGAVPMFERLVCFLYIHMCIFFRMESLDRVIYTVRASFVFQVVS